MIKKINYGALIFVVLLLFLSGCRNASVQEKKTVASSTKEVALTTEYLLGTWESTEADYPLKINITDEGEYLSVSEIASQAGQSVKLKKSSLTQVDSRLTFTTEDDSLNYTFDLDNQKQLVMSSGVKTGGTANNGSARPAILRKVK